MTDNYIKWTIPSACQLGEGPYYHSGEQRLYWVDIKGKAVFHCSWVNQDVCRVAMPDQIGWLLPTSQNSWYAGFRDGIYSLDTQTFAPSRVFTLDEPSHNRLNDAKVGRDGRLYFGSMDDNERKASGHLYCWSGGAAPERIDSGYRVSNGPAFSLDGRVLYSASSSDRVIYRMAVNPDGATDSKQPFIRFDENMGFPDGMTVDAENHLWVASWRGFGVYRFSPQGELVAKLSLPVPLTTSLTFAGPGHRYLAVTSARVTLSPAELERYPQSGNMFILDPGVGGVAEVPVAL